MESYRTGALRMGPDELGKPRRDSERLGPAVSESFSDGLLPGEARGRLNLLPSACLRESEVICMYG
jgi:hypothetical protein